MNCNCYKNQLRPNSSSYLKSMQYFEMNPADNQKLYQLDEEVNVHFYITMMKESRKHACNLSLNPLFNSCYSFTSMLTSVWTKYETCNSEYILKAEMKYTFFCIGLNNFNNNACLSSLDAFYYIHALKHVLSIPLFHIENTHIKDTIFTFSKFMKVWVSFFYAC